jgi:hypothetical protein
MRPNKNELCRDINRLLTKADEDEHYEATDMAENALSVLELVKRYLEEE